MHKTRRLTFIALTIALANLNSTLAAQAPALGDVQEFDLPAGDLSQSLQIVAQQTGQAVMIDSAAAQQRRAPALKGRFSFDDAVTTLLKGSGLVSVHVGATTIVRRPPADHGKTSSSASGLDQGQSDIVVTGSRIRGGQNASHVIVQTAQDFSDAGQSDLGEVARSLPENFSGGQNPGVAEGSGAEANENVTSASTFNLRGLGPDATLTLLDGHRLAYDSTIQGIDVTAIPLAAVERIEVVADGSSAIYGSDAVAGVANIILRRPFTGIEASAQLGGATEGGDFQQLYGLTGGDKWSTGGLLVAAEFGRSTAINSYQRNYALNESPITTILPYQRHFNALVSGHQQLGEVFSFNLDGLYNQRTSQIGNGSSFFSLIAKPRLRSYAVLPTLSAQLSNGWQIALSGMAGADDSSIGTLVSFEGVGSQSRIHYDNALRATELSGEGPLFKLGAHAARLAIGAGYRWNQLHDEVGEVVGNGVVDNTDFTHSRSSYYAYGELSLPFVSPDQDERWIHDLSASAALRYERYPGMASLATPKLGLIWAPSADVDVKGSWGKSFKTPTLYQQYEDQGVDLEDAGVFGPGAYGTHATALQLYGGNPELKPERATSWSATVDIHPVASSGLDFSVTWFSVHYRDRIAEPLATFDDVYGTPGYQQFISYSPSDAQQAAAISAAAIGLENYSDYSYDPAQVFALIDDRYANIERQIIHGIDAVGSYLIALGPSKLTLNGNVSYLNSREELGDQLGSQQLAGTIFNPPHWHGRAGAVWVCGALTASGFVNYVGSVIDNRYSPAYRIGSFTTADLHLGYKPTPGSQLGHFEFGLTIDNLFDQKPAYVRPIDDYAPQYDSTNQSAVGRFVSVSATTRW